MEVVIPTKIGLPKVRTTVHESKANKGNLVHLDWADEEREATTVQLASYQQKVMAHYNKRACPQLLCPGDMVLRRVFENTTKIRAGKL